jgi:hypothetical protein
MDDDIRERMKKAGFTFDFTRPLRYPPPEAETPSRREGYTFKGAGGIAELPEMRFPQMVDWWVTTFVDAADPAVGAADIFRAMKAAMDAVPGEGARRLELTNWGSTSVVAYVEFWHLPGQQRSPRALDTAQTGMNAIGDYLRSLGYGQLEM